MSESTPAPGWSIGRSILLELGMTIDRLGDRPALPEPPEVMADLALGLSESWQAERRSLLGSGRGPLALPLVMAWLGDALFLDDYTEATRRLRRLDLETALERMEARAAALDITADPELEPGPRLAKLWRAMARADFSSADLPELASRSQSGEDPLERLPRLLRGGEDHDRFWHWLDRFYYQRYAPWRETREEEMLALEQRARLLLGGSASGSAAPRLDWLPESNPLLNLPGPRRAVEEGRISVLFLVEPLGLSSLLLFLPGMLVTGFAEPGAMRRQMEAHAAELAGRLKAVADPTRLQILRLMRHLELDNTQIAAFLQIARPTVSIHARQLREAGLIETRREGRKARHSVQTEAVRALFDDLARMLDLPED